MVQPYIPTKNSNFLDSVGIKFECNKRWWQISETKNVSEKFPIDLTDLYFCYPLCHFGTGFFLDDDFFWNMDRELGYKLKYSSIYGPCPKYTVLRRKLYGPAQQNIRTLA